jgi:predicted nucleic acid-binding protein
VIIVDTNVFVIDLRYRRDPAYGVNRRFLDRLAQDGSGATTVINLLELAGILSFNLNERQLANLLAFFPQKYGVSVVPPFDVTNTIPPVRMDALIRRIGRRCSFGDALVLETAEKHAPDRSRVVSWDAEHLAGRTKFEVMKPDEALRAWMH